MKGDILRVFNYSTTDEIGDDEKSEEGYEVKTFKSVCLCLSLFMCLGFISITNSGYAQLLRVGMAKIDVTPELPVQMSGYSSRKELSQGIHDHLFARVTVFESGSERLVMVSTDLIGYYGGTYDYVIDMITDELGFAPDEVFLTGTHTHSGPGPTLREERSHPNNVAYTKELASKLVQCIRDALANARAVHIGAGRGYAAVGMNRREMNPDGTMKIGRNPYGPQDREVLVVRVDNPDGSPVGALFDYSSHATSLGPQNLLISGDILGIAAQFAEKIIGNGLIAPVFAGASGDVDPWYRVLPGFNTEPGWIPETVLLGTLLGEEVVHVYRAIDSFSGDAPVQSSIATVEAPGKGRGEVQRRGDNLGARQADKVPVNVTAARVGNVGFVGISAEVLTEIGWAIKEASPFAYTFIITHCNGATGYLPPAHIYKEGGYEINASPFASGAADMIVKEALRQLYALW